MRRKQTAGRLERALQETAAKESRLRSLVSASPVVIYTARADGDHGVTYMSENVARWFGYTAEDFVADSAFWADRIHPEDKERVFRQLERSLGLRPAPVMDAAAS